MKNIKMLWQHRMFVFTFIIPCLLTLTILELNNCITSNRSHNITTDEQNYALTPINSGEINSLYRATHSKLNVRTNQNSEKPLALETYKGSHKYLSTTHSGAGFFHNIHRKSSHQLCCLIDIPPPSYLHS